MIVEQLAAINSVCKAKLNEYVIDQVTVDNVVDKQIKIYNKQGMSKQNLNLVPYLELLPSAFMTLGMVVFVVLMEFINNNFKGGEAVIINIVSFFVIAGGCFYIVSKEFFGLLRKMMVKSVTKAINKKSKEYFALLLFVEEALNLDADDEVMKLIDNKEIFNHDDIRYLKIKGNGHIKTHWVNAITKDIESYNIFKEKVRELA